MNQIKRKEWVSVTNAAAIGYMIKAAKQLGLDKETIRQLERLMCDQMDFYTEEQAEREYNNF